MDGSLLYRSGPSIKIMIERELTYLAKYLPDNLKKCPSKDMIDIYIPESFAHPKIRIRKNGDKYEMTKKEPLENDPSHQLEQTIKLTADEFKELSKIKGKRTHKIRYLYDYKGQNAEFDVFQDEKKGLVVVDFEFKSLKAKHSFKMPDFCLADVTTKDFIAGGMICGKSYSDIDKELKKYNYKKLYFNK